jgi:hypothetical protein
MKGTCSDPRKFGLSVHDTFDPKGAFVERLCTWRLEAGGLEWIGGSLPEAKGRLRGEGSHTDVYTWPHLIGVLKSDSVV